MKYCYFRILSSLLVVSFLVLGLGSPSRNAAAMAYCDKAQYIADVTIPDGTRFSGGTTFTKTWRFKNAGTCTWTTAYRLVFYSGEQMGGPTSVPLTASVAPGQTVNISVTLTAPMSPGTYRGYWMLMNASGAVFGIGTTATTAFWVKIIVLKPFIAVYDFTSNYCSATWHYNGGGINCPVPLPTDIVYGHVDKLDIPTLEDGAHGGKPGLLFVLQDGYAKYIQGVFPSIDIFPGDHFQATIGCEGGAVGCYVKYQLEFMNPATRGMTTIWSKYEKYDGLSTDVDVDLSKFSWKKGQLVLSVYSYGPSKGDRALWVAPRLVRQMDVIPITPTPGLSLTPSPTSPPEVSCTNRARFVADITIPDWTTFAPNAPFTKTWRLMNAGTCTWTNSYTLVFFSGNRMGAAESYALPVSVVPGGMVDISLDLVAPSTPASYLSSWILMNEKKVTFGIGTTYDKPIYAAIKVAGTPLPTLTASAIPALTASPTASPTAIPATLVPPTAVPTTAIPPTAVPADQYTNPKYGFFFTMPAGSTLGFFSDNRARIALPFAAGTDLQEKYLDVMVNDGLSPCKATGFTNPPSVSSEVMINGTNFMVERGTDSALGNVYEWTSYSTSHDNSCISMSFILHSANNGAVAFDKMAEAAAFQTLMSTFSWNNP